MLRRAILTASSSAQVKRLVEAAPPTRAMVRRFVAGTSVADALAAVRSLTGAGLLVSLDYLGEDTLDTEQATRTKQAYLTLLGRLADTDLAGRAEVSVKLSALGQALPVDGPKVATENAAEICAAAARAGALVTLDMEDHTTTDLTLETARALRPEHPWLGVVLQAYLHRTETDCRDLSGEGSRVRLCKGAYKEPASVAFQSRGEIDRSYARCLRILMAGQGYPMVASHDPRLVEIAGALAVRNGRRPGSYEYQMLYGIRTEEQARLAELGETVRVYVPFGDQWYGYFMRRLAERPANVAFFLRQLTTKR